MPTLPRFTVTVCALFGLRLLFPLLFTLLIVTRLYHVCYVDCSLVIYVVVPRYTLRTGSHLVVVIPLPVVVRFTLLRYALPYRYVTLLRLLHTLLFGCCVYSHTFYVWLLLDCGFAFARLPRLHLVVCCWTDCPVTFVTRVPTRSLRVAVALLFCVAVAIYRFR